MGLIWVVVLSCLVQLGAAVLALRLIPVTKNRLAWGLVSSGLFLMAGRRAISLFHILYISRTIVMDPLQEWVGLVLSICMLSGIVLIKPLFTEIKQSEEEAHAQRSLLKTIIDSASGPVFSVDKEYRYTSFNKNHAETMKELYGADIDLGQSILDYITVAEDRLNAKANIDKAFEGEPVNEETFYGEESLARLCYEASYRPVAMADGNIFGVSVYCRDLTERKLAEDELKKYRTRLDLALKSAAMGVWSYDIIKGKRTFDEQTCRLLGIDPVTFTGTADEFFAAIHQDDVEKVKAALKETVEKDAPYEPEYRAVWPDGSVHFVTARGKLVRGKDGRPARINGILWDNTERKKAEIELEKHRDHLEEMVKQRTAELEAFTYSVSHDLRAPLRSIDGFSQVVLEDYSSELDDKALEYLRKVRTATERMALMIDDLLSLSRATQAEVTKSKVNLSNIAEEVIKALLQNDPQRKTEIKIQKKMTAWTDPILVRIVLDNLFANSWKFSAGRPVTEIEFSGKPSDGEYLFEVRDNGVGFDSRYAEKLFTPFQRLHSQEEFPGTGVGLATVARIVHRLDGRVWAESETDKGATFGFSIPNNGNGAKRSLT